jgi:hypothetical protein
MNSVPAQERPEAGDAPDLQRDDGRRPHQRPFGALQRSSRRRCGGGGLLVLSHALIREVVEAESKDANAGEASRQPEDQQRRA